MRSDRTLEDTDNDTSPEESVSDRDSPLGRYYRWLLDDPTTKEYWTTRRADREPSGRPRTQEES